MNRPWLAAAGIVALAVAALALVALALRPTTTTSSPESTPLESGAVAAAGSDAFRWVGPSTCNTEADSLPLERSVDGGPWQPFDVPLVTVDELTFVDQRNGIALGTTVNCSRGVAVTSDGGRTWTESPENPVLLDAWWVDDVVWGIERVIGTAQVAAFEVDDGDLQRASRPSRPCSASDGAPDQVAFWTAEQGLLLCQGTVSSDLLVARTTNGGESFEALADDRPELGLSSTAEVLDVAVAGTGSVWMLFAPDGDCREGELRFSDSEGASFTTLPCPRTSVEVDEVLDVTFGSETDGLMLGLRDREPVMAVTSDGGVTWQERN